MEIIGILFISTLCAYFLYQLYLKILFVNSIDEFAKEYYAEQEVIIESISKLNVTEKLKYGVPVIPFFSFYSSSYSFITQMEETYFRKIETTDKAGSEQIRYLEISFTKNGLEYNEFDVYEF